MKASKKYKEEIARIEHKSRLAEKKLKRSQEVVLDRPPPTLEEKPTILITCEGKNTEPSYFRNFRLTSAKIIPIGTGYNTISLVEKTIEMCEKDSYDQVWCVFDKDDFSSQDFNGAITKADSNGIKVAYSNQAFEYWIILHLEDHQGGALDRKHYNDKINDYLKKFGLKYDGNGSKIITKEIFDFLQSSDSVTGLARQQLAIGRAKRIYDRLDKNSPANNESSTLVFMLVEEISKYI